MEEELVAHCLQLKSMYFGLHTVEEPDKADTPSGLLPNSFHNRSTRALFDNSTEKTMKKSIDIQGSKPSTPSHTVHVCLTFLHYTWAQVSECSFLMAHQHKKAI